MDSGKIFSVPGHLHKWLLLSGIFSSFLYITLNVVTVFLYKGYDAASQTVSELSAIGTPTRAAWITWASLYSLLIIAFGIGVWLAAERNRRLRIVAILLIADAVIGLFWPPMHRREVLEAGGGTLTDTLHIVFTVVTIPLMIGIIAFGATAFGKSFRLYSIITLALLVIAGFLTGIDGPKIGTGEPTPGIGIWERINIGVYMIWIVIFSLLLLRKLKLSSELNIQQHTIS